MNIPTEKTKPTNRFSDKIALIYGAPKIGKSTLASQFPDTLFLATEDGLRSLEVFKLPEVGCFTTFKQLMEAVKAIREHAMLDKEPRYKTIVVDTIDNVYHLASAQVCEEKNIKTIGDAGFAKGYHACDALMHEFKNEIVGCGLGLVLISHYSESTNDTTKITVHEPSLPPRARKIFEPMSDLILACVMKADGARVIKTKPDLTMIAGDRTGRLPAELPLSFKELFDAFEEGRTTHAVLMDRCIRGLDAIKGVKWEDLDNQKMMDEFLSRTLGCPLEEASEPQLETLVKILEKKFREYQKSLVKEKAA